MKIPEFKRSIFGLIAEFRGILNGFPNLAHRMYHRVCIVFEVVCDRYDSVLHECTGHEDLLECCLLLDGEHIYCLLRNDALFSLVGTGRSVACGNVALDWVHRDR
jgi:hypothetical protein